MSLYFTIPLLYYCFTTVLLQRRASARMRQDEFYEDELQQRSVAVAGNSRTGVIINGTKVSGTSVLERTSCNSDLLQWPAVREQAF
jgi:hypothetical protein